MDRDSEPETLLQAERAEFASDSDSEVQLRHGPAGPAVTGLHGRQKRLGVSAQLDSDGAGVMVDLAGEPDTESAGLLPGSESVSFKLHAAETTAGVRTSLADSVTAPGPGPGGQRTLAHGLGLRAQQP